MTDFSTKRLPVVLDAVAPDGSAWLIPAPLLGQGECSFDERSPVPAGMAEQHADLAVLNPTGRTAVLAVAPDRLPALLHEAGLIEHAHGFWIPQMGHDLGAQGAAHRIRLPRGGIQPPLHAIGAFLPHNSATCQPFLRSQTS